MALIGKADISNMKVAEYQYNTVPVISRQYFAEFIAIRECIS